MQRIAYAIATIGLAIASVVIALPIAGHLSWYGLAACAVILLKTALAAAYAPAPVVDVAGRVAVVVPVYNEDVGALRRCLESIVAQSRPPDEIWVVDDGSTSPSASILSMDPAFAQVRFVLCETNRGKRHAQAEAFANSSADFFVTVDSDTILAPDALANVLAPFADPKVLGVTGQVQAANHRTNVLTRLVGVRYAAAFLWERAAYSSLGSVLCCCGSLAAYRGEVVRRHLDDYLSQTFLGVPVSYGDDRRMTNYCLLAGDVVFQSTAVAQTAVPERFGHLVRQQVRWNKSFFRETIWAMRHHRPTTWPFVLSFAELAMWAAFSMALVVHLILHPAFGGRAIGAWYLVQAALMAYARTVRFLGARAEPWRRQLADFALSPLYALLHVLVLIPLRLWSLATLRNGAWGTRASVEVRL